ncbi:MAG TPA: TetR/AcrR family transcriptional regulator [Acidimicrobiales bacterium]|nr:TetR/AcrR family transcriptional regulator [Acidimicrobiales bacterium]
MSTTAARTPHSDGRGRRTQVERRAASESRLLAASARLIAERGTTAVGFGEIAKAAGVSHGLPSYLFGTKSGLLCALVDRYTGSIRSELVSLGLDDASGLAAIESAMRLVLGTLREPWPQARALNILLGEALGPDANLRSAVNRYHGEVRTMVSGWMREGIEAGEIRPDVRPDEQATLWIAVLRGVSCQAMADPETLDVDAVADELSSSMRRVLVQGGTVDGAAPVHMA